jgi:predicted Fe-S protein YdhL (DUF1289 family)
MISPCILVCSLDPASGYCIGCGRTGAEIGSWIRYNDEERQAVMDALPARLAHMATAGVTDPHAGDFAEFQTS